MLSRRLPALRRPLARLASNYTPYDPLAEPDRLTESVDVCIVGGGPAGLSAAIRLAQLSAAASSPLRIVVLEKAADAGAHVLSGAVIEPSTLDALPDWRASAFHSEHAQPVTSSRMRLLTEKRAWPIPHPPQMSGKGSYVVSLSRFAAYLAEEAEALGVEVYPGFAGAGLLLSSSNGVLGVTTHDAGLSRQRTKTARFEPGMAFQASHVTEGMDAEPQTYGIGLKEVWRVPASRHTPRKVVHTLGWPLTGGPTALQGDTYGGGWVYHMRGGLVSLGLVVGLDYKNPWTEPYREFQCGGLRDVLPCPPVHCVAVLNGRRGIGASDVDIYRAWASLPSLPICIALLFVCTDLVLDARASGTNGVGVRAEKALVFGFAIASPHTRSARPFRFELLRAVPCRN
ncbi:hypothetical protein C8J57DRAFT_1480594 [Mycena rebaudengoi]|nr:hypothetical protein C8J57DRAFT_1480594 [Mycena rebaudengoi]